MRAAGSIVAGALVSISWLAAATERSLLSDFRAACQVFKSQKVRGTPQLVFGQSGWILLQEELKHLTAGRFWGDDAAPANPAVRPDRADPVPAILDFYEELAARGIEMYFMPIPIREAIYPESVLGSDRIAAAGQMPNLHPEHTEFLALLASKGVRVIDLTDTLLQARSGPHGPLFCPSDSHWTGAGAVLAAEQIARRIRQQSWYGDTARNTFTTEWSPHEHHGRIYKRLAKAGHGERAPDPIQLRTVRHQSGEKLDLDSDSSPVMVLGDSNTFWWKLLDASLAHQLAAELGFEVRLFSTAGGGATDVRLSLVRALQRQPSLLQHTRAIVWCFSARIITNTSTGWLKTPLPAATESSGQQPTTQKEQKQPKE